MTYQLTPFGLSLSKPRNQQFNFAPALRQAQGERTFR